MKNQTLAEARRLYDLGYAIHWLKPKSKMPVESGWTKGPRNDWEYLEATFQKGMNVGVRLGRASEIEGNFLAVIDVDVKSEDPRHKAEVISCLRKITGSHTFPEVTSGRGNGSRHYYILTPEPLTPFKAEQSLDVVKVSMPSAKPSKRELETLTSEELELGLRLRPAWEIAVMGEGQQVVLPPSIHPDSGKAYAWCRDFNIALAKWRDASAEIKAVTGAGAKAKVPKPITNEKVLAGLNTRANLLGFKPEVVEVEWLPLADKIKNMILTGEGVSDRSASLLPIASALHRAGLTQNEILSVLTDTKYFIGGCAYDHAKTQDRGRAAAWAFKYSLEKVLKENSAAGIFGALPLEDLKELAPEVKEKIQTSFDEGTTWRDKLDYTEQGRLRNSLLNFYTIFKNECGAGVFKFNELAKTIEVWEATPWGSPVGKSLEETDVDKIQLWLEREPYKCGAKKDPIWGAIINIAHENKYHPVREYLNALPPWDGIKRVDGFVKNYLKGEGPKKYLAAASRKTLIAMVARVFDPGCKFDTMLILEGAQGLRKSSAIRALASDAWFSDVTLNLSNKDSISDLAGKWVIEHGELSTLNRSEVGEFKQFLSRSTDRMRPPYGRTSQDFPRQCVFIGSTNDDNYLNDSTGGRRFLPVIITDKCDVDGITRDRDQLFAEALVYYKAGETLWIDDEETEHLAKEEQSARNAADPLTPYVVKWLEKKTTELDFFDEKGPEIVLSGDFLAYFAQKSEFSGSFADLKLNKKSEMRVAEILKGLGFKGCRESIGGVQTRGWVRKTT